MTTLQAIFLGILQGATEFIPVSSSGHLVLLPWLLGWPEPGLVFDAIVHWGTVLAVLAVFWRDLGRLLAAGLKSLRTRSLADPEARVAWWIVIGTVPAVIVGYLFQDFFASLFGTPIAAACFLLITGLILIASERLGARTREAHEMSWYDALLIGLAQAAAIAPGISRSGATIAAGLLLGVKRTAAARYSFLLSVPVILGAGALSLLDLFSDGVPAGEWPLLIGGFLAAALSGYLCIRFLLNYLRRGRLYVFAAYLWLFGLLNLVVALARG
ncbi:MAG: undecaprenyl-diphosphatase UppP [Anaerolineaceae bacterium 4572_32.1]|nr:MAG: undecaprenyl-diphosphatase UppP [Anaerolineaceae bacterium 4572_32.1]